MPFIGGTDEQIDSLREWKIKELNSKAIKDKEKLEQVRMDLNNLIIVEKVKTFKILTSIREFLVIG